MIIDLTQITDQLNRIESKLDKILEFDVKPPTVTPTNPEQPEPSPQPEPEKPTNPEPEQPNNPPSEVINFTDAYYKAIKDSKVEEIYLEEGKTYKVDYIERHLLMNRKLKIHSGEKRATLIFGVENYTPQIHKKQDGELFLLHDNSTLIIENVNICQPKQLKTVQYFNPRIFSSAQWATATWTAIIKNCDTTMMGNNGGFGIGFAYGSPDQNHLALINFKHYGTGLMDAKNPYQDGIMYVSLRDVDTYAYDDIDLSSVQFEHIGTLKDNILTFDGSIFELSSGYNFTWRDNTSYLMLYDRYTFFIDGYKDDTIISDNQIRLRPQAKGKTNVGVLSDKEIYSNEVEMHSGDQFEYRGEYYTIISKDRIKYPYFDERTTQAKKEPKKSRALVYELNKPINTSDLFIDINYKSKKIKFKDAPITLVYRSNGGFKTTENTKYREPSMITGSGIGHLSYNHSDISMNAKNVKHRGFYRGSEKGKGISLIWNLVNCEGFKGSGNYFNPVLPVTSEDIDLPERILNLIK